ncbi:nuclear transport factor 2 family protein [Quadrisphaera sp. GCM10027208]|uniref:nuclear transport factor 2 family protein n=1 Tax=Quadrisphaera sp. GCM10027208 TaxID=3273423 RepID=UPI003613140E
MRSTDEVIRSHLAHRAAGDLEGDLAENYHDDVVLLSWGEGVTRGKDGVRRLASILKTYVSAGQYRYDDVIAADEFAMLRWHGEAPDLQVHDGTDSFVVRGGLIVAQTIAYAVDQKP